MTLTVAGDLLALAAGVRVFTPDTVRLSRWLLRRLLAATVRVGAAQLAAERSYLANGARSDSAISGEDH